MDNLKEMRAKSDLEALHSLMIQEEKAMKEIFANTFDYHQDELTIGYVIFLHRRIVDMLNCLNQTRKNRGPESHEERMASLERQLFKLSLN